MIKNEIKIINDSIKCASCENKGHRLGSVLVKMEAGYRTLQFCICCGSPSVYQNLDYVKDH